MERGPRLEVAALFGLAAAVLVFEITLLRVFSFTIWHHFSFMVISVALLGLAVSGVLLRFFPGWGNPAPARAGTFALLFGLGALAAVAVVTRLPLNTAMIGRNPAEAGFIGLYFVVLAIPFTCGGLGVLVLLRGYPRHIFRLYAGDLAGAGLGCLLVTLLMGPWGAEGLLWLTLALAAGSATLLFKAAARPWALPAVVGLVALLVSPWGSEIAPIPAGRGKLLGESIARGSTKGPVFSKWGPLARIDVVEGLASADWTLNPRSPAPPPSQTQILIDGEAETPMMDPRSGPLDFLDFTLSSAGHQVLRPERVLVIGPGGGVDVLTALHHGARQVQAVEINPVIAGLVTGPYASRTGGLFSRPEVRLHVAEGRSFVRGSRENFDLLQLSLIDTWAAAASGAYSLSEGYLYTVEAFQDYWARLSDRGALTITRWEWIPPRELLRLCSVAVEALRREGIDRPQDHIVVLGLQKTANLLLKKQPWTKEELGRLAEVVRERGWSVGAAPDLPGNNPFQNLIRGPDRQAFIEAWPFDISPPTDDRPFFFQFGRWRDLRRLGEAWKDSPLLLSGRLVLLAVLVQALVLSLLLLVLPAWGSRRRGPGETSSGTLSALTYFFLVGLAFMLLEIALMQRFTLFLGSPVQAVAVVLAVLLVSAGAGSWAAGKMAQRPGPWTGLFTAVAALAVLYAFFLPPVFRSLLGLPALGRGIAAVVLLAPLGFLLGIPFPAGLKRLEEKGGGSLIPWAWAANGCASVIGPIVATILGMEAGFTAVLLAGAGGYASALVAFRPWWKTNPGAD